MSGTVDRFLPGVRRLQAQIWKEKPSQDRAKKAQPAGTLVIRDSFQKSEERELTHGGASLYSAQQQGFKGNTFLHEKMDFGESVLDTLRPIEEKALPKREALAAIETYAATRASAMVEGSETQLWLQEMAGDKNTVLNLSMGVSKARVTEYLYESAALAWRSDDEKLRAKGDIVLGNLSRAFETAPSAIKSQDPAIHGPARHKLQQGLIDHISSSFDESERLKGAKNDWDQTVERFESGKNSVVVATGNMGEVKGELERDNGGRPLRVPSDFQENVLENDLVTSVGATRWFRDKSGNLTERVADYSNRSRHVDLYASGSVGILDHQNSDIQGTSFGAPRVAGAMAELHRQNPQLSSSQIEGLMKQTLTHQLPHNGGEVEVLDYGKTFEFLQSAKY